LTDTTARGACGQWPEKHRAGARPPFRSTPSRTTQESRSVVV
jgi:hypothetical protein